MSFHPLLEKSGFVKYSNLPTIALKKIGKFIISNPANEIKQVRAKTVSHWRRKYSYDIKPAIKIIEKYIEKYISKYALRIKLKGIQSILDRLNSLKRKVTGGFGISKFVKSNKLLKKVTVFGLLSVKHRYNKLVNQYPDIEKQLQNVNMNLYRIQNIREKLNERENHYLTYYIRYIKKIHHTMIIDRRKQRMLNHISIFNSIKYTNRKINITYNNNHITDNYNFTKKELIEIIKKVSQANCVNIPSYLSKKKKQEIVDDLTQLILNNYNLIARPTEKGNYEIKTYSTVLGKPDNINIMLYYDDLLYSEDMYVNDGKVFIEGFGKSLNTMSNRIYSIKSELASILK
jgi:hypothetical protein